MALSFKVTYATISADNEELQSAFDDAIATVKGGWLGAEVPMFINGKTVHTQDKVKSYSPIDRDILMCTAQNGDVTHADAAIAALVAACGSEQVTVFSSWDPLSGLPPDAVISQNPPAGTPITRGDPCVPVRDDLGIGISIVVQCKTSDECLLPPP